MIRLPLLMTMTPLLRTSLGWSTSTPTDTRMPFLIQNLSTIHTKTKEHPINLPVIQQQPAMATPAPVPTKVSSEKLDANGGGGGHTLPSEPKVVLVVLHSNATGEPIVRLF